jgi:hypothetical protein
MIYNEKQLLTAIEQSFKMYKLHGARSTEKLYYNYQEETYETHSQF